MPLPAGDQLRDEVDSGSELGRRCDALMKEGTLVPQEVRGAGTLDPDETLIRGPATPGVLWQPSRSSPADLGTGCGLKQGSAVLRQLAGCGTRVGGSPAALSDLKSAASLAG